MKKILALMLALALGLAGCASKPETAQKAPEPAQTAETAPEVEEEKPEGETRIITDANGREVEIPAVVNSIVCVNVGTLRFTSYMQAQDLVVGVENYEHEPSVTRPYSYVNKDVYTKLPIIGDNGTPYNEEIVKVAPDVVMTSLDKDAADSLQEKLEIPVVTIPLIDNMFDEKAYETLALMGEVYGRQERAEELTAFIKSIRDDLDKRTAGIKEEDKSSVYPAGISFKGAHGFEGTEAGYSPLAAINADNLANKAGQEGAFNIDVEQVLSWDPDIILVDFNGLELINEDYAKNPDFYNSLTAVKEGRVYSQISFRSYAVNADLSLVDAYYSGKVVFPEAFADVNPEEKADEIFKMMLGTEFYDTLKQEGYEFKEIKIGE